MLFNLSVGNNRPKKYLEIEGGEIAVQTSVPQKLSGEVAGGEGPLSVSVFSGGVINYFLLYGLLSSIKFLCYICA